MSLHLIWLDLDLDKVVDVQQARCLFVDLLAHAQDLRVAGPAVVESKQLAVDLIASFWRQLQEWEGASVLVILASKRIDVVLLGGPNWCGFGYDGELSLGSDLREVALQRLL